MSTQPLIFGPWFVLIAGLVAIGLFGALVGVTLDDTEPSTAAASSSSSGPSPVGSSAAPSTTTAPRSTSAAPTTALTTTAPSTTSGVDFLMPDVVGMDLQSAQNLVQTFGVFLSVSHDLLGSRNQLVDSNWIVCDQNVAPGEQVSGDVEGQLDFGVVKREEQCP